MVKSRAQGGISVRRFLLAALLALLIGTAIPYLTYGVHASKPEPLAPQPSEEQRFKSYLEKCSVVNGRIYCP